MPLSLNGDFNALPCRNGVRLSGENALPVFALANGPDTVALDRVVVNTRAW